MGNISYAAQPRVVLFCSTWNIKCRDAQKACSVAAKDLGLYFIYLDIDTDSAQQMANKLEIIIPSSIPYIYVLNNRGKIEKEWLYRGENAQLLKQKLSN